MRERRSGGSLVAAAVLTVAGSMWAPVAAHAYGGHGGHGGYGGYGHRGGLRIGIGLGFGGYPWGYGYGVVAAPGWYGYPAYGYPAYVTAPPVVISQPAAEAEQAPSQPLAKGAPDPIFYPRNGQSAEQTEADRQACNRWAVTVPNAVGDASVFQRATLACMDGRGYTVR